MKYIQIVKKILFLKYIMGKQTEKVFWISQNVNWETYRLKIFDFFFYVKKFKVLAFSICTLLLWSLKIFINKFRDNAPIAFSLKIQETRDK